MYECISDKYGSLELTFAPDFVTHSIQLRVLYVDVMAKELRPPIGIHGSGNVTFGDHHLIGDLIYFCPFRRAFIRHDI